MAKFDAFLSLDCARVEGVGAQSKERNQGEGVGVHNPRKGRGQILQRSVAEP